MLGINQDDDNEIGGFSKQEKQLLQNRRTLDEAKRLGFETEDVAKDIKYNLRKQTDKLEGNTLSGLFSMQSDLSTSAKLLKLIDWERRKNRWTIIIVIALLALTILGLIIYKLLPEDNGEN